MRQNKIDISSGTLASVAYVRLRSEIIAGMQAAGSRLHIGQLCDHLGIGLSPVREALNRLSAEGLVRQIDQRGFRVAPLDVDDLRDLTRMRCWLNEIGLRAAIADGDAAWEEALIVAHHRLMRAPRESDRGLGYRNLVWEQAHRDFHAALIAACGSSRLMEQCAHLFDAFDRYRHVGRSTSTDRSDASEHTAIMEATVRRSEETAVALLMRHILQTEANVRHGLGAEPLPEK